MAHVPDEVLMERMTWRQIETAITNGKTTVLLNAGAIEQHGPHLPTATDTLVGHAVAERSAHALGDALVAPMVRPALSAHHLGFPGTLALEFGTFVDVLTQIVRGLADAGFRNIALLSSHGGNVDIMLAHVPMIARSVGDRAAVFMIPSFDNYFRQVQEILDAQGISRSRAGVHAGYAETSMMLYLHPDLVDLDNMEPGLVDDAFYRPENLKRSQLASFTYGVRSQSPNGVLGDPTGANAEVGRRLVELQVQATVDAIRSYLGGLHA
jgi:creatinine amidohydrolase